MPKRVVQKAAGRATRGAAAPKRAGARKAGKPRAAVARSETPRAGSRRAGSPRAATPGRARAARGPVTLTVDIGGSGLKAALLDSLGRMITSRVRVATPVGQPPRAYLDALAGLVAPLPPFQRISVGFPGVVRGSRVLTAPNLGHDGWRSFDLAGALTRRFGVPARLINDAEMQGLAVISGRGVEMVVTLGTGFGTALFEDGRRSVHLEISHHPFRKGQTYDQQLGNAARKRIGPARWNRRVQKAIENMQTLTLFDHLYVGGGNAEKLTIKLPENSSVVPNVMGVKGGVRLWDE